MTEIDGYIRAEEDGSLSFGDYTLDRKTKVLNFEQFGDSYDLKTYHDITKLDRNGLFVYESVPGTVVRNFQMYDDELEFTVEGFEDTQIALGLEADEEYRVYIDDVDVGSGKTNLGGKLIISVELGSGEKHIRVV